VGAAPNEPIAFSQAGSVTIALDRSSGGFDHVLEISNAPGPVGTPIFALTDLLAPSGDVLGYAPADLGATAALGSFAAGQEITLRLTNVESFRLGTPGAVADQTFSGTASSSNPNPGDYYTFVEQIDPLTLRLYWEDAFPVSASDPDPAATFANDNDVVLTLTLAPVPEPSSAALVVAGGLLIGSGRLQRRLRVLEPQ
jgi:hypothetical protein